MKLTGYHLLALFVIVVWGTTFVSTKLLLLNGLAPQDILLVRFVVAYGGIWFFGRERLRADSWRDEGKLLLLGILGGSVYTQVENVALEYTHASNVALIVSIAPLLTALLAHFLTRGERIGRRMILGSIVAFVGVAMVIFNGSIVLDLHPLGDMLCLYAAFSWAFYTLILKDLSERYSALFITRKIFFYGLLTTLPILIFWPPSRDLTLLARPVVWGNLLYLSVVASLLCIFFWSRVVAKLGAVRATNYIYFSPLITLVTAAAVLGERITPMALMGAGLILFGVIQAERK